MVQSARHPPDAIVGTADKFVRPSEADIYTVTGQWLGSIFPFTVNVIQGQQNRAPLPPDPCLIMTIIDRTRLATNSSSYTESTRTVTEPTQITMQVQTFGRGSGNLIQSVKQLWRDENAVDFFKQSGFPLAPLYTSGIRQLGFINGERQYEDQWSIDLLLEANITITLPQQTANKLTIGTISVDAEYPPEE
ncbi:phage neck terminator protein [Acetobacter thailandicus]|uniref:phage neck terminator protein n=1 Tax=Acetobacter thailandicus TaxID=1502842 RepID=UPI001BAD0E3B|nr:hypothetical protein [Acetobacter thailandicus]MBS0959782.1 hypothetical protein [Acetobacter thailandicus]